jgi:histidinol-phosphatase (PHP family)
MHDRVSQGNILADYHVHSRFSPDANDAMDRMCWHALRSGFKEIAFTEHMEWNPDWDGNLNLNAYIEAIQINKERYAPEGLKVLSGIEIGNPHNYPDHVITLLAANHFDIVIGSMHWLQGINIHLEDCFIGRDPTDVYTEYYLENTKMSQCCEFDILAHVDRIFWPGWRLGLLPNIGQFESVIRLMLSSLADWWQSLELNTKYLTLSPD